MTDATEITNIVFSALSDRKGFDDWFDQIDEELQTEIKSEIAEAIAALRARPAEPLKKLSDAQVLWLAESHGIDVYASNPLAFYADLISTTPAQPDHSELVKNAARYRWLREQHWSDSKFAVVSNPKTAVNLGSICPSRELLDEAIDAVIRETME